MRVRNTLTKLLVCCAIGWAVATTAGCASIDHVNAYRGLRDDFNAVARGHNAAALNAAFASWHGDAPFAAPADPQVGARSGVKDTGPSETAALQEQATAWQDVYERAKGLNARSAAELKADGLYGASRTLEIVARTRRMVAEHLLRVAAGPPASGPAGAGPATPAAAEAVTEPVAEAQKFLAENAGQLQPRDEYMLRVLRPTAIYEIAMVNARRARNAGLAKDRDALAKFAGEIAQADQEFAAPAVPYPPQTVPHATLSRFIFLQAGVTLVRGESFLTEITTKKETYDLPGFRALADRVDAFRAAAVQPEKPEHQLVLSLQRPPETFAQTLERVFLGDLKP